VQKNEIITLNDTHEACLNKLALPQPFLGFLMIFFVLVVSLICVVEQAALV
jgi:hypothetical protein